jgi:hypothetical protein
MSSVLDKAMVLCAVIASMVVCAFIFGRIIILNIFKGSACNIDLIDELEAGGVEGAAEGALLVFFLKKRCSSCIALLTCIKKISLVFSNDVKFVIIIDGFAIDETVKFGDSYVVPDAKGLIRSRAKISSVPTVIAVRGKDQIKYVGLNACSQGMLDLIYSTL